MSGFHSYYTSSAPEIGQTVHLDKDESHHLVAVLRAKINDPVTLFNGKGLSWRGKLSSANSKSAALLVEEVLPAASVSCAITLAQAMPKGKGMEAIIRKATEIGVEAIIPLKTARTELKLDEERQGKRITKWQSTAIEASKQSGNLITPEVAQVQQLNSFLEQNSGSLKLIASLQAHAKPLDQYFPKTAPESITWLIGPEGDFSDEEYKLAEEAGFLPVSLASHVLRIETAVIYALSITDYELKK